MLGSRGAYSGYGGVPKRIFSGVRFVLFGFDSVSEAQYQSELIRRGGTNAGKYDSSCTHVIVSGRTYDDPVCVAARNDGKSLVTELWVDDSVDFGVLPDPAKEFSCSKVQVAALSGQLDMREDTFQCYKMLCPTNVMPSVDTWPLFGASNKKEHADIELPLSSGFEFSILGTPADLILYRPVKDLNGIPGSELLCICLTGYQRQERDVIMKMVSLMGARFSKPLIANQVTHLICYKFEGEKYELAKRVHIKLVNHRWLEDSLRAWEILPIDNYTKSSWELEVLEVKARDSEEETDDGLSAFEKRSNGEVSSLQSGVLKSKGSDSSIPIMEGSNIQRVSIAAKEMQNNDLSGNKIYSTPCKESSEKISVMCNLNNNVLEEFDHHESSGVPGEGNGYIKTDGINSAVASISCEANLKNVSTGSPCNAGSSKRGSPETDAADEKMNARSRSGKNPRKLTSLEERSESLCGSSHANLEYNRFTFGFDVSSLALRQARSLEPADTKNPETHLISGCRESPGPTLLQKNEVSPPSTGSKPPKSGCQNSSACDSRDLSPGSSSAQPVPALMTDVPQAKGNHYLNNVNISSEGAVISSCIASRSAAGTKIKSIGPRKRGFNCRKSVSGTNASNCNVSPSYGKLSESSCNPESRQVSDEPTSGAYNLSALKTKTSDAVTCPMYDKTLQGLPFDAEQRQDDAKIGIRDTTNFFGNLAIGSKRTVEASTELKMSKKSLCGSRELGSVTKCDNGDILMNDFPNVPTEESEQPKKQQKGEWESSSGSRDSCSRKLPSPASAVRWKESKGKVASGIRIKTVAKRNLGCRSKLSTLNIMKERCVTSNMAVPTSVEPEPKNSNNTQKNKIVGPAAKEDNVMDNEGKEPPNSASQSDSKGSAMGCMEISIEQEKENNPNENSHFAVKKNHHSCMEVDRHEKKIVQSNKNIGSTMHKIQTSASSQVASSEPAWFILSGHRLQRKEFRAVIRRLRGRLCRDSHQWSYQATHFITPDPVRRTEKFFAAAAAGRWILKTDYLTASNEAGKFLEEEPFEWYRGGLSEDGAINLEAPRKWRLLRERTGHGTFYGMRVIIYGDCVAPTLDTLKRAVKAGDGTILATSPPYTRFLKSGVDFAIVSPGMLRIDSWVQEFLRYEIPCVAADYLVEYVCKPGYSLERHVLYKTHAWAEKSFANLLSRSEEIVKETSVSSQEGIDDLSCSVCGSRDRGEVMLICGNEEGSLGCGIGTHIDCCDPPLEAVPEEDWFCPNCSSSRVCKTPLRSTRIKSLKCK